MVEKIDLTNYLHNVLDQAMRITDAQSSAVLLVNSLVNKLHVEVMVPTTFDCDMQLAHRTIQEQETIKEKRGKKLLVYVPLVAYEAATLGAIAFHFEAESISERVELTLKMIGDQVAVLITNNRLLMQTEANDAQLQKEHNELLKVYDAIPALEFGKDVHSVVTHVAEIYHDLKWSPIRITLRDGKGEITESYTLDMDDESKFPPITADLLESMDGVQRYRNALFVSNINQCSLFYISVQPPDASISASVELYNRANLPAPSEQSAHPLLIFAYQFGNAIARTLLIESLQETTSKLVDYIDELEFIRKADREISSRLDPNRIVQFTLDWAVRRTAADAGGIVVIDPSTHNPEVKESLGYPNDELQRAFAQEQYGAIVRVIRTKKTQLIDDVTEDPDYVALLPRTATQLIIPFVSHKRSIGAITLESKTPGQFDSNAIEFIERFASMTAIALDNAQLLQQAEQLADDMSLIYNAGRTISSSLEWENAIQSIAQGMALAVKGSSALIYAYQSASQRAQLLSIYTVATAQDRSLTQILPVLGTFWDITRFPQVQKAISNNQMLIIKRESDDTPERNWLTRMEGNAAGITPLTAQGEPVGIAVLLKTGEAEEFVPSEIFVAESLATQAAAVLRQASLYSEILELETLKSEMIRMASHDLRAPISNAVGYLQLLEMDISEHMNEDLETYLTSIRRSLDIMRALVEDLLTLEKVESQRAEEWEKVQFNELVMEAVDEQIRSAQLKHQTLKNELPQNQISVRGNRTHLRQCITNLVSNAIKYTPDNGTIIIRSFIEGDRLFFETEDNGYGISEDRQKRIFQRFYRAKQPGTEHIQGTGLGLSLVKSIIERHGGQISFRSQAGEGTTFTFWLPLALENQPAST